MLREEREEEEKKVTSQYSTLVGAVGAGGSTGIDFPQISFIHFLFFFQEMVVDKGTEEGKKERELLLGSGKRSEKGKEMLQLQQMFFSFCDVPTTEVVLVSISSPKICQMCPLC